MKVMILANNDVGLYQFRKELIEELIKEYKVVISLPDGDFIKPLENIGCKFIDTPVDRRGINPIKDLKLFFTYQKILRQESPNLIITYTIKPNVYGSFACRILKLPYTVNITGLGTAFQKKSLLKKLVTVMYKVGLKKARVVFFENEENQQIFLNEKIIREGQACLLHGAGVNLEHFQFAEYPADVGVIRFLFIGRVMKEKGIDELLEAMSKLRVDGIKCFLDVVGGYEENYAEKMKVYEKEGWLHYHGYQEDVRPFIRNCHCFVLPSWHEGMANTNLEAAAMGRPVITSNIHGCLEAVEDGVSGYLSKRRNSKNLYKVMKRFAELSYEERKAIGVAGRKHMEEVFDRKKVVKRTIDHLFLAVDRG